MVRQGPLLLALVCQAPWGEQRPQCSVKIAAAAGHFWRYILIPNGYVIQDNYEQKRQVFVISHCRWDISQLVHLSEANSPCGNTGRTEILVSSRNRNERFRTHVRRSTVLLRDPAPDRNRQNNVNGDRKPEMEEDMRCGKREKDDRKRRIYIY